MIHVGKAREGNEVSHLPSAKKPGSRVSHLLEMGTQWVWWGFHGDSVRRTPLITLIRIAIAFTRKFSTKIYCCIEVNYISGIEKSRI